MRAAMVPLVILILSQIIRCIQGSPDFVRTIKYPMPHYNEVAPCACDLTEKKCDTQCCCDQDCPVDYHGNWTCTPGLYGGLDPGKNVEHNCSYEPYLFESDWNSILCIFKSRASYLGLYYEEPTVVTLSLDKASTSPIGSYKKKMMPPESFKRNYKHGYPVRVVYNDTEGIYGHLNMPSVNCLWAPVAFLVNSESTCRRTLAAETCQKHSMLDYQMYLMPLPRGIKVGNVAKVLKTYNSNQIVPLKVNYYSALLPDLYVSNQLQKGRKVPTKTVGHTGDSLQNLLKSFGRPAVSDSIFRGISNEQCTKMELFPNEDQYQEAQVNLEGSMCNNAVLEVSYKIFWRADEIAKMDVNILLGNLTIKKHKPDRVLSHSQFQELQQKFTVKFEHVQEGIGLSGNPGYQIGKPVLGAKNDTELVEKSPKIWSTHRSSLCMFTPLQSVNFLKDSQSGCLLELSKDNLTNCEQLREDIKTIQYQLMNIDALISKGGSLKNESFVSIIFEDFSANQPTNQSFCAVPSHVHMEVTFSNSSSIYRINGVKVNYLAETWSWICPKRPCGSTRKFQLQSSVQFIEVPVVWHHQNTSKFWILQRLDLCNGDKCWAELFYPFTHSDEGSKIAFVTMCALTLIPGACLVLFVTKDYW